MALLVANWKMHGDAELARSYMPALEDVEQAELVVAPPAHLLSVCAALKPAQVQLAGQNCFAGPAQTGAFTGEISAAQLQQAGAKYCIIGHSERRQFLHESDAIIGAKLAACLASHLTPILCVGEDEVQNKAGNTRAVVYAQLAGAVAELDVALQHGHWVIAYEPVWAIGSGRTPSSDEIAYVLQLIKEWFAAQLPKVKLQLLYGGSVSPTNIAELWQDLNPLCTGFLIGGASRKAADFLRMAALIA